MEQKKVIVYVDGYNFYYGLRNLRSFDVFKWSKLGEVMALTGIKCQGNRERART